MRFWVILALSLNTLQLAFAGEVRQFYRGTRAMAMGNAYTAIADDEMALYLNPAGMAGNVGTQFYPLNLDFTVSRDIISSAQDSAQAFSNISGSSLSKFVGKNVYMQAQYTPTLTFPNFGIGYLVDQQYALRVLDRSLPDVTLGYQTTNGIQFAYGTTVGRNSRNSKSEFRLGIGGKMMFRRGGYRKIPLLTLANLDRTTLGPIIGNYSKGYGVDLGSQYIRKLSNTLEMRLGATYLDVGDTTFGDGPDPMSGNFTVGSAVTAKFGSTHIRASYDFKNILDRTDWRKKNHFGLETKIPMVSLWAGVNQVSVSYGAGIDLWLIKLQGASYAEELGSYAFQNSERRYMIRASMVFTL